MLPMPCRELPDVPGAAINRHGIFRLRSIRFANGDFAQDDRVSSGVAANLKSISFVTGIKFDANYSDADVHFTPRENVG